MATKKVARITSRSTSRVCWLKVIFDLVLRILKVWYGITKVLTIKYMHVGARSLGIIRHTGIVARVSRAGAAHRQSARPLRQLRRNVEATVGVVVHHAVVVIPEHENGQLGAL